MSIRNDDLSLTGWITTEIDITESLEIVF